MDMGRFLIEMHLRTGKPIKELARAHDVNPSWLFKLLRRERGPGSKTAQKRRATQQRRGAAGHEGRRSGETGRRGSGAATRTGGRERGGGGWLQLELPIALSAAPAKIANDRRACSGAFPR